MSKRKKQRKRRQATKVTRKTQVQAANVPQQQPLGQPDPRLRAEAQEKHRRKQLRRQITEAFSQLRSTEEMPSPEAVRDFIVEYLDDIELVRQALQSEKNVRDPWSEEIWRLLRLNDSELRIELAQILEEKGFAIEATKMLIRHRLPDPLVFHIPTTTDGPDYHTIGPEEISDAVVAHIGEECSEFTVQGDFPFSWHQEYQVQWASRRFEECSQATQQRLLSPARSQLGLGDLADLSDCVRTYRQEFGRFQTLLRQMRGCTSLHGIVQTRNQLYERLRDLDFLLSPTNREIVGVLAQAIESAEKFLHGKSYEDQRNNADTAINLLEKVLIYGADNYTALWAEHFGAIAQQWRELISREIEAIAKDIAPFLEISLAEERISLTNVREDGERARVIFRIENKGSGQADRVNTRFHASDGRIFNAQRQDLLLRPGGSVEDYFELESSISDNPLSLEYTVSYYNPDRQFVEFSSKQGLCVLPLIDTPALDQLASRNPFKTDKEVDDELMFVGRDHLLEEVSTYAIDQPRGSLLMLHGQRRVGKSSLLLFLEREADRVSTDRRALGVRVTWLDYTAHSAPDLMSEIASVIHAKYRQQYQQELSIPDRQEFRQSYSLAFNDVLRELQSRGMRRLVLMWDEFDGLVNHLDKPEMRFDRVFFEYLRGLSKRRDVTLVLAGGELMPILFEHWGEVFNHDRTWRIAYLSPTDGSVEKLVRNDYVKGLLSFSDEAIDTIKEYSACNPFFVQMICRELVNAAKAQKSPQICKLDVGEVVKWLVQQGLDSKYMRHLYSPRLKPDPFGHGHNWCHGRRRDKQRSSTVCL